MRGSADLAKRGSNADHSPPNHLISFTFLKNLTPSFPPPLHLPHNLPIALAGDLVRTGYQGRASVPDWSHNGVRLGDEPLSSALEPGAVLPVVVGH